MFVSELNATVMKHYREVSHECEKVNYGLKNQHCN